MAYDLTTPNVKALIEATAALTRLCEMMQESMGAQRLPGSGNFAFRFMGDPECCDVGPEPIRHNFPEGYFEEGGAGYLSTSYLVVNPNLCWVRLRGTAKGRHLVAAPGKGRLFAPGLTAVFSTLKPISVSTLAEAKPGFPLPSEYAPLELYYGGGT